MYVEFILELATVLLCVSISEEDPMRSKIILLREHLGCWPPYPVPIFSAKIEMRGLPLRKAFIPQIPDPIRNPACVSHLLSNHVLFGFSFRLRSL